jgi:hypothetical protein
MATANFSIAPEDGWVAVTAAATNFFRVRSSAPNHAFFVTSASALPAATVVGYKVDGDDDFIVDVATTDKYYVRAANNLPAGTRIDAFYI